MRASTRTRSRGVAVTVDTAGADSSRGRRRRQHAGAHRRHLHRRGGVDRGDELAAERRLPRDQRGSPVVDLEPDRVAGESGAERGPRRAPRPRGPTWCSARARPTVACRRPSRRARVRDVVLDRRAARPARPRRRPTPRGRPGSSAATVTATAWPRSRPPAARRRRAARGCRAARSGSTTTATAGPDGRRRGRHVVGDGVERRAARGRPASPSSSTAARTCSASGPSRTARRARSTSMHAYRARPWSGSPAWPHGPAPRSAARTVRGCDGRHRGSRPRGRPCTGR